MERASSGQLIDEERDMESKRYQASQRMRDEVFKVMLQDPRKNTPALDAAVAAYLEATEPQEQTPMSVTTDVGPAWAQGIKEGDWLTISVNIPPMTLR